MKKSSLIRMILIVFVFFCFLIFDSLVVNVGVAKRSIVVGVGIDYFDEQYELTAQVILPKNGGVSNGGNNFVIYSAKSKDIEKAMELIGKEDGSQLSFGQTVVLVVGKELAQNNKLKVVETFFMDDKVHDNVQIVMAENKASEVLKANVAVGEVASLQLFKQLRPAKNCIGITPISLQEYMRNSYSKESINYMPVVKIEKTLPSTDQSKNDVKEADKFNLEQTAIFDASGLQCVLDSKMSAIFSLAKQKLQNGIIEVASGEKKFSVSVVSSKSSFKYDLEKMQYQISLHLKTIRSESRLDKDGKISFEMSESEQNELYRSLFEQFQNIIDFSKENKIDLLKIRDGFCKKYPKSKDEILKEDFLDKLNFVFNLKIEQV